MGKDEGMGRALRREVGLASAFVLVMATFFPLAGGSAGATEGAPWDPSRPRGFQSVDVPGGTRLSSVFYDADTGRVRYVDEGTADVSYNALGYNPTDDYMYAVDSQGHVVQLGRGNVVVNDDVLGGPLPDTEPDRPGYQTYYTATVDDEGTMYAAAPHGRSLQRIDLTHRTRTEVPLSPALPSVADWTLADGRLWGAGSSGDLVVYDPETGRQLDHHAGVLPPATGRIASYGAAWTQGNGDLVFADNASGHTLVVDPATLQATSIGTGPLASSNDGTAVPGRPVDLTVGIDGPALFAAGDDSTHSVTVRNLGDGDSGGGIAYLALAGQTSYADSSVPCTAGEPGQIACPFGPLAAGAEHTFEVTIATDPDLRADSVATAVLVRGTEEDPDPANDRAEHVMTAEAPAVDLTASVSPGSDLRAGDLVTYELTARNAGNSPLAGLRVRTELFTGRGTPPQLACSPGRAADLDPGELVDCAGTYEVTDADAAAGSITLEARACTTGDAVCAAARVGLPILPPAGPTPAPPTTAPPAPTVPPAPTTRTPPAPPSRTEQPRTTSPQAEDTTARDGHPRLELRSSSELGDGAGAGDPISYTVVATNAGNVPLDNVHVREREFTGFGALSAMHCTPAQPATLAPGASMTCTTTYQLVPEDLVDAIASVLGRCLDPVCRPDSE